METKARHGGNKREAILRAAKALFLEHGFASTSVDAVTSASGVSKPTIYSHFPTKEALLEGVVRNEAARHETPVEFLATDDPLEDLELAAACIVQLALSPETLAWDRMMSGEAKRKPELGAVFFECGPQRLLQVLGDLFRTIDAKGGLAIPDPELAAELFFGMVAGLPLLRAGLTGTPRARDKSPDRSREIAVRFARAFTPVAAARKPKRGK